MSTFNPGASSLKSTTKPAALFESARLLDLSENLRNGANPGITPKNNISVSIDFGQRTIAIAATIPATTALDASGKLVIDASDYLGAPHSAFTAGGDVKSTDTISAFVEVAQILASAEKAVQPVEDQPNNCQVVYDGETGSITVSANLPCTVTGNATGDVVLAAVDYL